MFGKMDIMLCYVHNGDPCIIMLIVGMIIWGMPMFGKLHVLTKGRLWNNITSRWSDVQTTRNYKTGQEQNDHTSSKIHSIQNLYMSL